MSQKLGVVPSNLAPAILPGPITQLWAFIWGPSTVAAFLLMYLARHTLHKAEPLSFCLCLPGEAALTVCPASVLLTYFT